MSSLDTAASVSSLHDAVHEIEPVIRAHAEDAERERRLPDAVAEAMRACGLYRLWRPTAFGGLEVDPMTAFLVVEEVSRIDSAAGWNLQLSSAIDAVGAWFPDEGAKEIYGQPDASLAGSFFPPRRAVVVDGGYRVTGQTPFVSGAHQASWFLGLAHVYDDDTQRLGPDGAPVTLLTMCPASKAVIVDNWRTLGMRGTGSHDVLMTDVFVPSRHTALLAPYENPGSAYQGPLYKFTVWTSISVLAPPALGIARAAIDDLLELAARKDAGLPGNAAEGAYCGSSSDGRGRGHTRRREGVSLRGIARDLGRGARRPPDRHARQDEAAAGRDLRRSRGGESCRPRAQGCWSNWDSRGAPLPALLSRRTYDRATRLYLGGSVRVGRPVFFRRPDRVAVLRTVGRLTAPVGASARIQPPPPPVLGTNRMGAEEDRRHHGLPSLVLVRPFKFRRAPRLGAAALSRRRCGPPSAL